MKKITLLLAALSALPVAYSQCTEPAALPYQITSEDVSVPALPDCVQSNYNSFSSSRIFETLSGPVEGFEGNVLAYNTLIENEFMPPDAPVNAYLYSPLVQLEQGKSYIISYKYGNSDAQLTIGNLYVSLQGGALGNADVATHTNITGATATTFLSQPITVPATGIYKLFFDVMSEGTQGLLYLDDISIEEVPTMGIGSMERSTITIYPNPTEGSIQLNNAMALEAVEIFNVAGQNVFCDKAGPYAILDLKRLEEGIYFMHLKSGGEISNIKIIKK